jgi:hypothetical protein
MVDHHDQNAETVDFGMHISPSSLLLETLCQVQCIAGAARAGQGQVVFMAAFRDSNLASDLVAMWIGDTAGMQMSPATGLRCSRRYFISSDFRHLAPIEALPIPQTIDSSRSSTF